MDLKDKVISACIKYTDSRKKGISDVHMNMSYSPLESLSIFINSTKLRPSLMGGLNLSRRGALIFYEGDDSNFESYIRKELAE